jgi:hypothetical protein
VSTAIEGDTLESISEAERIDAAVPDLFADGKVSAEEQATLDQHKLSLERAMSVADPTKRKMLVNKAKRAFLEDPRIARASGAVVTKIADMFDLKAAEDPIKERYGDKLYAAVTEKYTQPTMWHFIAEARMQQKTAEMKFAKEEGAYNLDFVAQNLPGMVRGRLESAFAQLHDSYLKVGAVSDDWARWYNDGVNTIESQIRKEIQDTIAKSGGHVDAATMKSMNDQLQEEIKRARDIGTLLGTNKPGMAEAVSELYKALGEVPQAAAGVDMSKMVYLTAILGLDLPQLIELLKDQNKAESVFKTAGITTISAGDASENVQHLMKGFEYMATMSADKLPDPRYRTLATYLAGRWVSNDPAKAPPAAIELISDELDKAENPSQVGIYLLNNPGYSVAAEKNDKAAIRIKNKLRAMKEQFVKNNLTYTVDDKDKVRAVQFIPGEDSVTEGFMTRATMSSSSEGEDLGGLSAWLQYLKTPQAQKLLGGERAYLDFKDALTHVKTPSAKQPAPETAAKTVDAYFPQPGDWSPPSSKQAKVYRDTYEKDATAAAEQYNVPQELFHALIGQESKWDPQARSEAGALGLAQVMPSTLKGEGWSVEDMLDPVKQLQAGAKHLQVVLRHFGFDAESLTPEQLEIVLASYNSGQGTVSAGIAKYGSWDAYKNSSEILPETKKYVRIIRAAVGV